MKKAVFFDFQDLIEMGNWPWSTHHSAMSYKFYPNVLKVLRDYYREGYKFILFSDVPCISTRGVRPQVVNKVLSSVAEDITLFLVNDSMSTETSLNARDVFLDTIIIDTPNHSYALPSPAGAEEVAKTHKISLKESVVLGFEKEQEDFAKNSGMIFSDLRLVINPRGVDADNERELPHTDPSAVSGH